MRIWSRQTGAGGKEELEYELLDTGVFDQDRYFDVFVEYAKESPRDLLIRISIHNRGPDPSRLHVLPTLWFRNEGSWPAGTQKPALRQLEGNAACRAIAAEHPKLGLFYLYCDGNVPLLFTENETNTQRLFGVSNVTPYVKDGINNYVVLGQQDAVNHEGQEQRPPLSISSRSDRAGTR